MIQRNKELSHRFTEIFKMTPSAAPGILTVEGVVAFVLALVMLFRYGNLRKQNPLVTLTTLLIWFLSFFIVFLLPIDVTSVGISFVCHSI